MCRIFGVLVTSPAITAALCICSTEGEESPAQEEQRDNIGGESARNSANTRARASGGAGPGVEVTLTGSDLHKREL